MILEKLKTNFALSDLKFSIFNVSHLKEAKSNIQHLLTEGSLDKDIYDTYLSNFDYDYDAVFKNAKSIIIVAAPHKKSIIQFTYKGKKIETILPPQYAYPTIDQKVNDLLKHALIQNGYRFQPTRIPLKLLAAKSGLCKYGRNNIGYIPGIGSFSRLTSYITDYDPGIDQWGELEIMDSCKSCSICADKCPTKAIDKHKFLIDANKCLTHFNEFDKAIPDWIQPQWHNSIVGCMECQNSCPHNRELLSLVDKNIIFNEAESAMILNKTLFEELPGETKLKLHELGMSEYYNVLSRNMKLLLDR